MASTVDVPITMQEQLLKIRSQADFYSGVMFAVIGGAFAFGATGYNVGEAARMGPGYFPFMVGVITALLGVGVMIKALVTGGPDGDPVGRIAWRPLTFIIGANLAFGVLLAGLPSIGFPAFGLIVAIYALTFIASLAAGRFAFKPTLILATILASGSYFAFVVALNLQFPVWPSFFTR